MFGHKVTPGAPVLSRIGSFVEGSGLPAAPVRRGEPASCTGRPPAGRRSRRTSTRRWRSPGLGDAVHRRVRTYSQGMRQRLAIAQAMLGLPDLLVLDEPTNGLDPPQIHQMREVLRRYAAAGRTVLVSSHLLAEVEQTCDHVVVMHKGKLVAAGEVEDIAAGGGEATFRVDGPTRRPTCCAASTASHDVHVDGPPCTRDLDGVPARRRRSARWCGPGVAVEQAGPRRRLEDAFLELVGESEQHRPTRTASDSRDGLAHARCTTRSRSARLRAELDGDERDVTRPRTRLVGAGRVGRSATGPGRTLRLRVELARQLRRRRTQLVLGLPGAAAVHPGAGVRDRPVEPEPPLRRLRRPGHRQRRRTSWCSRCSCRGSFLLPMIVALFFGDTIASEASWSSLKYLLAAPIPRHRLLRQKAIASGLLSRLRARAAAGGRARRRRRSGTARARRSARPATRRRSRDGVLGVGARRSATSRSTCSGWPALALFLSVSTDAPLGAVGGTVLVSILSQILDQITALEDLRNYLPTHYAMAWADLISTDIDWSEMTRGAFSALVYGGVLHACSRHAGSTQGHHVLSPEVVVRLVPVEHAVGRGKPSASPVDYRVAGTSANERQVCPHEVITDTEQRFAGHVRDRVGETVSEVQRRRMPPFAELAERVHGDLGVRLGEGNGLDVVVLQETGKQRVPTSTEPRDQHYPGLQPSRGTDFRCRRLNDVIFEVLVPRFATDNRDDGGSVDDHTPSGPKPRISSCSALVIGLPRWSAGTNGQISSSRNRRNLALRR